MSNIEVSQCLDGVLMREGAGVKLHRYIGADRTNDYEPILLFDFFDSTEPLDYLGGFPAHPHRGFETITYLLQGKILHEDNQGRQGLIGPGDVQWMTAGKGVIHSEMPVQTEGALTGLQLWLNLPAANKMSQPRYQEYTASQLPIEHHDNGTIVKVIAGKILQGTESPIKGIVTEPVFLDIQLPAEVSFSYTIAPTHQAILFILSGLVSINDRTIKKGQLAVLSKGENLTIAAAENSRCLLIAAKKLHEPIARLGPFVMNTQEEIIQAVEDFRNQRF
ncbi:pirin-like protein [Legionella beliardensis]|uniref:Pirin-like protein n=1 Tax=Legionella beliardensis TaxID=91822 RepID=A0A378I5W3_9GAMM|nr:pirin family protein [Legionella beliardensis]STX30150.1 pirin-like protein [Legionella beliardensis]